MNKRDFLLEIGCEEIPARFVDDASKQLGEKLAQFFSENRIGFGEYHIFATPRRLAILVKDVAERQEDVYSEVKGPAERIAKNPDGSWSKAAEGFARKQGITADQLVFKEVKGENYVFAQIHQPGKETKELLLAGIPKVISSFHFPKTMRWGIGKTRFIRPVRWLVCLFGEEIVPIKWGGITAGRITKGHRFLGSEVELYEPQDYESQLEKQYVIADVKKRKSMILDQIHQLEKEKEWSIPVNEDLLNEVVQLVEYPTVLFGSFDPEFLDLPHEILITTMREHQRYFPVESLTGELLPYFVTVRNGNDRGLQSVAKGNEKVLRARLADARFFFEEDLKLSIDSAIQKLDQIVYQEELGSLGERTRRIAKLATKLADKLDLTEEERKDLIRAGEIAKFDLSTQVVGEFPELEGVMGRIYALNHGESQAVADAIFEHHLPRYPGDSLPQSQIGTLLSVAEKIDAVVSSFAIGIQPTGSQDPYGLRRKASGVVQILLQEKYQSLSLEQGITWAIQLLEEKELIKVEKEQLKNDLLQFFALRLKTVMQDEGIRYDVIDAILHAHTSSPFMTLKKAHFIMKQIQREEFKNEVEAFTRVANLARKAKMNEIDPQGWKEEAEKRLYHVFLQAKEEFSLGDKANDPEKMYRSLQLMVPEIHQFFDQVMVMVEDEKLRNNRLALLANIMRLTHEFASFDRIVFPAS